MVNGSSPWRVKNVPLRSLMRCQCSPIWVRVPQNCTPSIFIKSDWNSYPFAYSQRYRSGQAPSSDDLHLQVRRGPSRSLTDTRRQPGRHRCRWTSTAPASRWDGDSRCVWPVRESSSDTWTPSTLHPSSSDWQTCRSRPSTHRHNLTKYVRGVHSREVLRSACLYVCIWSVIDKHTMPGRRRQSGQRRQWLDDIIDWAEVELPRVVHLAGDRREFRSFVRSIVQATHGAWHTQCGVSLCPLSYIIKNAPKLHEIFLTCYVWSWLDPSLTTMQYVMYFRFRGWRHVFT